MRIGLGCLFGLLTLIPAAVCHAQDKAASSVIRAAYEYEAKPNDEEFAIFYRPKRPHLVR